MSTDVDPYAQAWADWLRVTMGERDMTATDVMNASGTKANGRPVIHKARVTSWLGNGAARSPERPSYRLAVAAAHALGVDPAEALAVAGYTTGDEVVTVTEPGQPAWRFIVAEDEDEARALRAYQEVWRKTST